MPAECCRENVAALVATPADLQHVEGVVYGFYPIWHAWAIEADGSVVDPTWPSTRVGLGAAYFGAVRKSRTGEIDGEASLLLQVPEQFARILSDNIHRLRDRSFIVQIDGLTATEGRAKRKRTA